jgi:uncharacterized membrane protein
MPAPPELRQPHQIVGGGSEGKGPPDEVAATELRLPLAGNRLDPAERLFDALADALAKPCRAAVDAEQHRLAAAVL